MQRVHVNRFHSSYGLMCSSILFVQTNSQVSRSQEFDVAKRHGCYPDDLLRGVILQASRFDIRATNHNFCLDCSIGYDTQRQAHQHIVLDQQSCVAKTIQAVRDEVSKEVGYMMC